MHSVAVGDWVGLVRRVRSGVPWSVDVAAIDQARVLRGWTRRELGRRARVDEGTLCDLFARRRCPTLGTLRALCAALDLSLAQVVVFAYYGAGGAVFDRDVNSS